MKKLLLLLTAVMFAWTFVAASEMPSIKSIDAIQTATPAENIDEGIPSITNNGGGSDPIIATTFLQDDFSDGDFTNNPTWTATSNGNGDGTEDWTIYADPWTYTYGTVENHNTGFLMGSDSDGGGAVADETMSVPFSTDGTGTLRLAYWLHFRAFAPTLEYFDVLIDGNIVEHVVNPDDAANVGLHVVDIDAYNDGASHTLAFHYFADWGYVAAFDDVIITNETVAQCPPNGIAEGEPDCFVGYVDVTNGGCSYTPNIFGSIAFGDTICGESGVMTGTTRDNDWFEFTTPGLRHVHFEATSNFPFLIYIYQPAPGNLCTGATIVVFAFTTLSGDTLRIDTDLPLGTYWVRVRPYDFSPLIVCGEARYVAWLYADPPLERDARVVSVDSPILYRTAIGEATDVMATVTNFGEDGTYDFDVTVDILGTLSGQTYSSTRSATDVGQLENIPLTFDDFTPSCLEDYTMTVTCSPTNDQVPDNNVNTSTFRALATGYDTYTDGTIYWSLPTSIVSENCVRFRVPAGHTAALTEAAMAMSVSGVPGGLVTPKIYATDGPNGYPGTVLWTGTPFNVTVSNWYYIDLTSSGVTPTSDFYFGYSTVATTGPSLLADPLLDYVGVNFSVITGNWTDSYDIWVTPPDYHIWLDYDITGGNFTDGEATTVDSPVGTLIGAGPFPVLATVTNTGTFAITGASASATVTGPGGVEFTSTVNAIDLAVGASTQVNFGNWAPSGGLVYFDVDVTMTAPGDQNTCNDVATVSPFILLGDVLVSEDFEADNGGLTEVVTSGPPVWQYGTDALAGAHSGTNVWGTILDANYPDNACASLRTTSMAVPGSGGAFAFYAWYATEGAWDFCNVKISTDGGTSFSLLTPLTGYDMLEGGFICALLANQMAFTDVHMVWALQAFDLTGFEGTNAIFSIDFGSDTNTNDHGFYLDDLMLIGYPEVGCNYIVGDINNFGGANGIDVTFGVSYFKGGAAPPIDCNPPCTLIPDGPDPGTDPDPAPDEFYTAGDVNGNCAFNGIDITFYVSYLKELQPALLYCPTCPPAGSFARMVRPLPSEQ